MYLYTIHMIKTRISRICEKREPKHNQKSSWKVLTFTSDNLIKMIVWPEESSRFQLFCIIAVLRGEAFHQNTVLWLEDTVVQMNTKCTMDLQVLQAAKEKTEELMRTKQWQHRVLSIKAVCLDCCCLQQTCITWLHSYLCTSWFKARIHVCTAAKVHGKPLHTWVRITGERSVCCGLFISICYLEIKITHAYIHVT